MTTRIRQSVSWAVLVVVAATLFSIGVFTNNGPSTDAERSRALWTEIGCPTCQGQSVAESNASSARNIRNEISRQIDEGRSDTQIRAFLADRYGSDTLLRPAGEGFTALVWVVPVVAGVLALVGLALVFRRWADETLTATDEDRDLVAAHLRRSDPGR